MTAEWRNIAYGPWFLKINNYPSGEFVRADQRELPDSRTRPEWKGRVVLQWELFYVLFPVCTVMHIIGRYRGCTALISWREFIVAKKFIDINDNKVVNIHLHNVFFVLTEVEFPMDTRSLIRVTPHPTNG